MQRDITQLFGQTTWRRFRVPVMIVQSEFDEFIQREHAEYLAQSIPDAEYVYLTGMSHFAGHCRGRNSSILLFLHSWTKYCLKPGIHA